MADAMKPVGNCVQQDRRMNSQAASVITLVLPRGR
jgi:hypothetical protein